MRLLFTSLHERRRAFVSETLRLRLPLSVERVASPGCSARLRCYLSRETGRPLVEISHISPCVKEIAHENATGSNACAVQFFPSALDWLSANAGVRNLDLLRNTYGKQIPLDR